MRAATSREYISLMERRVRKHWLQDSIAMVRDAVNARRASTGVQTPLAIEQIAFEFGLTAARGKKLFYAEAYSVTRDAWVRMKIAALAECDTRERLLRARLEAAQIKRRQYQTELGAELCGYGGNSGPAFATGEHEQR